MSNSKICFFKNIIQRSAVLFCLVISSNFSYCYASNTDITRPLPITIKQQLLSGQFASAAKELRALAKIGNAEAKYQLAILLLNGKGVTKSPVEAEKLLISSAASGNKKAKRLISQLNNDGQTKSSLSPNLQIDFIKAIKNGELAAVKKFYQQGADINHPDQLGFPPLIIAINAQQSDIVQWLMQQQPLLTNQSDKEGNTALHHAAKSNQLKLLIAIAVETKNIDPLNDNKQTPLMLAAINRQKESAQWLLSKKANPDAQDIFNKSTKDYANSTKLTLNYETSKQDAKRQKQQITQQQQKHQLEALTTEAKDKKSLHYQWPIMLIAVAQKQTQLSESLLAKGQDPWQTNPLGETAIALALATEQPKLVDKMLQYHPINPSRDKASINSLFSLAIQKNNAPLVQKLLLLISKDGVYADRSYVLSEAVKTNSPSVVEYLLKQTKQKPTGEMLHLATQSNYVAVVTTLLNHGAPVNWKGSKDRQALWIAAENSNPELISLLLGSNVEVDAADNKGQTALMRAAINDCEACARQLLKYNANPQKASLVGNTSVMFAAQKSDRILKLFLQNKIDLSKRNKQTLTPLMLAIKSANLMSVKTLLDAGANPKRRNELGENAFDMAKAHPEIIALLEKY